MLMSWLFHVVVFFVYDILLLCRPPNNSYRLRGRLRWNGTLYIDQNCCLNLVKKDQLFAIALVNRK